MLAQRWFDLPQLILKDIYANGFICIVMYATVHVYAHFEYGDQAVMIIEGAYS